ARSGTFVESSRALFANASQRKGKTGSLDDRTGWFRGLSFEEGRRRDLGGEQMVLAPDECPRLTDTQLVASLRQALRWQNELLPRQSAMAFVSQVKARHRAWDADRVRPVP